ncbi:MAG TPA: tetratricopeptide repeat protein [Thermoanaerobaculia bacterium]|nr:tetratricopeptide repeat protein [Thermoanaerobaculia bacterium]
MSTHIPDEELSLFAMDPESLSQQRRGEIERHTSSCAECGASFDFYLVTEEDLRDPLVWQPLNSPCPPMISEYARRCEAEDAEADRLLEPYMENAAKAAWDDISNRREFQTGGVVRRLNARAHAIVASEPLAALTFADLAQAIASVLPDHTYPSNNVYELRGTAWKERANALLRLGKLDEALESLKRADRAYGYVRSSGFGLATVELVRAAVYYQKDELAIAAVHAELAEAGYAFIGMQEHRMKAVLLRGQIRYEALEYETASAIFQQLMEYGEEVGDAGWIARGAYCRGACELKRGKLSDAAMLFNTALVIFRETGPASERISTEWGLARVVLDSGNASEALPRLRAVVTAFEELGMVMDAAVAGLDVADALLVLAQQEQIAQIAAHSYRVLSKAGVVTGALTALAYLKETASHRRVKPKVIDRVRTFLRRTERDPELVFVPPLDTSD